jgi:hypothetical protein
MSWDSDIRHVKIITPDRIVTNSKRIFRATHISNNLNGTWDIKNHFARTDEPNGNA